jgi:hypothetical protein
VWKVRALLRAGAARGDGQFFLPDGGVCRDSRDNETVPRLWCDVAILATRWGWSPEQVRDLSVHERLFYLKVISQQIEAEKKARGQGGMGT